MAKEAQKERMERVAAFYNLDPDADRLEVAARAASSLPDEENGTWSDVALCLLRNACVVAVILAAVGSPLPGSASADDTPLLPTAPAVSTSTTDLLAFDGEELDILASIAVPLGIGIIVVSLLASQYERLIDKLNGD